MPGVVVESLRPYHGGEDLHRDLELVDVLAPAGRGSAPRQVLRLTHLAGIAATVAADARV